MQKKVLYYFVGIIVYRYILDLCYVQVIEPVFNYLGFVNRETFQTLLRSWGILLLMLPLSFTWLRKNKPSSNVLLLIFLASYVPFTSLICFIPTSIKYIVSVCLYWISIWLIDKFLPNFKFPNYINNSKIIFYFILVYICVIFYVSGKYTGFRLYFSFDNIYDLRFEARKFNIPILFEYILAASRGLLPIFLIYSWSKRKFIWSGLIFFAIILNFGIGGNKSIIFLLILSIIGYRFSTNKVRNLYVWGMGGIGLLALIEQFLLDTRFLGANIIYRFFYIPSFLDRCFFDFFQFNEFDFFRQGILRRFGLESPYEQGIDFIIADIYFGIDGSRANNGLFSDAYMNMGILGCILMPFFLVFVLRLFDACARGIIMRLLFVPIIVFFLDLRSGTLTIALLTGGLLFLMLMLYFFPRFQEGVE